MIDLNSIDDIDYRIDESLEKASKAFPELTRWFFLRRKLRFLWQRLFRGWSDVDTWSLDIPVAKFVLPRLRRFKELNNGYPCDMSEKEWDGKIDQMIEAFDLLLKIENGDVEDTVEMWEKIQVGFRLFGENLRALWW